MLEIITQINDLIKRVGKLESLETPFKSYGLWANRPTAPFDGQRFFATDSTRRIEYEWDNTASNWLSTQLFTHPITFSPGITFPATATAAGVLRSGNPDEAASIFVTKITVKVNTQTTLDATNNWTVQFNRTDNVPAVTSLGTVSSWAIGRVAGKPVMLVLTLNTGLTQAQLTGFSMDVTKNAAPGNLNFEPATVWYRLIG